MLIKLLKLLSLSFCKNFYLEKREKASEIVVNKLGFCDSQYEMV